MQYVKYGGLAAGLGIVYGSFLAFKKNSEKYLSDSTLPLLEFADEDTLLEINQDNAWMELCDRMAEFATLCKDDYSNFLLSVAEAVKFQREVDTKQRILNIGTPRLFATKLHAIIEDVRSMRACLVDKAAYVIDDFDEVASDVQKKHDDEASNMILQSMCH